METYQLPNSLNLFLEGRISFTDAERQTATAKAILERLPQQPGLILADEVGMGKTFVALAVAISVYLKTRQPVVIMIPANLVNKWPNDFKTFKNSCIRNEEEREKLRCEVAKRPEEFFKLLDDDENSRCAVIFLTHGALARNLGDGWVKLAIIQKALFRRWETEKLYRSLHRYAGVLVEMQNLEKKLPDGNIWEELLKRDPREWRKMLIRKKVFENTFDDPVPHHFLQELEQMPTSDFNDLFTKLRDTMPERDSSTLKDRLRDVRGMLNAEAKEIWKSCLKKIRLQLPLLVFDEAHHLKNAETRLVTSLFHNADAEEDAGLLTNQFDRMLFLTATPFQLGHHELVRVLERFITINWSTPQSPAMGKEGYESDLKLLLKQLDESQIAARRLDSSWGKLSPLDLTIGDRSFTDVKDCWNFLQENPNLVPQAWQRVMEDFQLTQQKIRQVEPILSKYVIRHLKARFFTDEFKGILRRNSLPGKNILTGEPESSLDTGLIIEQESLLPFLLAARLSSLQQDKRPVFAEGLASSYEAFRYTREERLKKERARLTDTDDDEMEEPQLAIEDADTRWYLDQLDESLSETASQGIYHPKIKATLERAMELWMKGEKVLIFCHYIATGKALRKYLSEGMRAVIRKQGAQLFSCDEEEVFEVLEKIANRTTDKDSPLYKTCVTKLDEIISNYPALAASQEDLVDAFLRYMRTPSFLIRFAPKVQGEIDEEWIARSFQTRDASGMTLELILQHFLRFLANRNEERDEYIAALKSIQPGGIRVKDIQLEDLEEEEREPAQDNTVMANVRLCYGNTKQETRQKLMKTFNSPFFPDILITSSVMAEGVDLHLNCRHIIHHDLCWNPSTLEQRTGRVDRIGSKAEKCGQPIKVYLPYISQTQDEKMYKVVTERERWFNIVMGDKFKVEAGATDKYAERLGFPEKLVGELCFHLQTY